MMTKNSSITNDIRKNQNHFKQQNKEYRATHADAATIGRLENDMHFWRGIF
jgi:hypothetical protein